MVIKVFALNGDKTPIPNTTTDGSVSYDTGYGSDYSLQDGEAGKKNVERDKFNDLMNVMTTAINELQVNGLSDWESGQIYNLNSLVRKNKKIYLSQKDANTSDPEVTDWLLLDFKQGAFRDVVGDGSLISNSQAFGEFYSKISSANGIVTFGSKDNFTISVNDANSTTKGLAKLYRVLTPSIDDGGATPKAVADYIRTTSPIYTYQNLDASIDDNNPSITYNGLRSGNSGRILLDIYFMNNWITNYQTFTNSYRLIFNLKDSLGNTVVSDQVFTSRSDESWVSSHVMDYIDQSKPNEGYSLEILSTSRPSGITLTVRSTIKAIGL